MLSKQQLVAEDAISQIECAKQYIAWLRSTLHLLESRLQRHGDVHGAGVANLAIYNADDWHNWLDCEHESLGERIKTEFAAPQNDPVENVARVSLAEFAKGRQHEAAKDLGVEQAAISKAIRVGRTVFVTRHADGSCSATEEKPFPSPRFGGAA